MNHANHSQTRNLDLKLHSADPGVTMPTNNSDTSRADPSPVDTSKKGKRRRRRLSPLVADAKLLARLLSVGLRTIRTMDYAGKLPRPIKLNSRTAWVLRGKAGIYAWLDAGAPPRDQWEAMLKAEQRGSR